MVWAVFLKSEGSARFRIDQFVAFSAAIDNAMDEVGLCFKLIV